MQGEFNYDPNPEKGLRANVPNTTDKQEYKRLLIQLKDNMQNDILKQYGQQEKPVFITYQTGAQYMRDTLAISMAQLEASNEYADIICAGPIYPMTDRGGHLMLMAIAGLGKCWERSTIRQRCRARPLNLCNLPRL